MFVTLSASVSVSSELRFLARVWDCDRVYGEVDPIDPDQEVEVEVLCPL